MKLQDEGVIQKYYNKWWKEASTVKCDKEDKRKDTASELGFANIGGAFVILAVGLVLSMIVAAVEFAIKIRQRKGRQVGDENSFFSFRLLFSDFDSRRNDSIFSFRHVERQCIALARVEIRSANRPVRTRSSPGQSVVSLNCSFHLSKKKRIYIAQKKIRSVELRCFRWRRRRMWRFVFLVVFVSERSIDRIFLLRSFAFAFFRTFVLKPNLNDAQVQTGLSHQRFALSFVRL